MAIITVCLSYSFLGRDDFPGWKALIPVAASALVIANRDMSTVNRLLATPLLQYIGTISYSLYLWHWPIYVYLARCVAIDQPITPIEQAIGIAVSLACSIASYRYIETPFRSNRATWSNRRILFGWSSTVTLFVLLLVLEKNTNALIFPLPDYIANAEIARRDINPRRKECFFEREDPRATDPQYDYCTMGIKSKGKSVVLWGDSFADSMQPMVEEVLSETNLSGEIIAVSGCAPIDRFPFQDAERPQFRACASGANQRAFDYIMTKPSINVVLLTGFWEMFDFSIVRSRLPNIVCLLNDHGGWRHPRR